MRRGLAILVVLWCAVGDVARAGDARPIDIPALRTQVFDNLEEIAGNPDVVAAVRAQNNRYEAMTGGEIDAVRAVWHGERLIKERPLMTAVMDGPPAQVLKAISARKVKGGAGPLYVTDARGLIVAASHMPQDYRLTPEALWEQAFLIGPHRMIVTPTARDPDAPMWISVSVADPRSRAVIGVVSTLMVVPRLAPTGDEELAEDEESDEFEMRRPQELVYGANPDNLVSAVNKLAGVAGKARGVAGHQSQTGGTSGR